ncbi:hypothetical protein Q1695_007963 [Nippostrongylus brasiliensis]|nr:hypothetical protein Q1695_007963 [Nippostrongylus brasiliensis]
MSGWKTIAVMWSICHTMPPPWPPWSVKWKLNESAYEPETTAQLVVAMNFSSKKEYLLCTSAPKVQYGYLDEGNATHNTHNKNCYSYQLSIICRRGSHFKHDDHWLQTALNDAENKEMANCAKTSIAHHEAKHVRQRNNHKTSFQHRSTTASRRETSRAKAVITATANKKQTQAHPSPPRSRTHDGTPPDLLFRKFQTQCLGNSSAAWNQKIIGNNQHPFAAVEASLDENKEDPMVKHWRFFTILLILFFIHLIIVFVLGFFIGMLVATPRKKRTPRYTPKGSRLSPNSEPLMSPQKNSTPRVNNADENDAFLWTEKKTQRLVDSKEKDRDAAEVPPVVQQKRSREAIGNDQFLGVIDTPLKNTQRISVKLPPDAPPAAAPQPCPEPPPESPVIPAPPPPNQPNQNSPEGQLKGDAGGLGVNPQQPQLIPTSPEVHPPGDGGRLGGNMQQPQLNPTSPEVLPKGGTARPRTNPQQPQLNPNSPEVHPTGDGGRLGGNMQPPQLNPTSPEMLPKGGTARPRTNPQQPQLNPSTPEVHPTGDGGKPGVNPQPPISHHMKSDQDTHIVYNLVSKQRGLTQRRSRISVHKATNLTKTMQAELQRIASKAGEYGRGITQPARK